MAKLYSTSRQVYTETYSPTSSFWWFKKNTIYSTSTCFVPLI